MTILSVGRFLDLRNADAFLEKCRGLLGTDLPLIVRIERDSFLDYDGVKALSELYIWQLQREDVAEVLYAVESPETHATLTQVGFSSWLPFYSSMEEARQALEEEKNTEGLEIPAKSSGAGPPDESV